MKSRVVLAGAVLAGFLLGLVSIHPVARAIEGLNLVKCARLGPCQEYDNLSVGSGLTGLSNRGSGVIGLTTFASTSATNGTSGLIGQDTSKSGNWDAGVRGGSKQGYGVFGASTNGTGVYGQSVNGTGIVARSTNGAAVLATSNTGSASAISATNPKGTAVTATSTSGTAITASSNRDAIDATSNSAGFAALSAINSAAGNGFAIDANSYHGNSVYTVASGSSGAAVFAVANNGADLYDGIGAAGVEFLVDKNTNIHIAGQIFTTGTCQNGCLRRTRVQSYGTTAAVPTIEDAGEAQLHGGAVSVRLDPAFANTIDPHQGYLVLITPEGDTRGLFVAQRTMAGFTVRETLGGRSNIPFAYRIVAHPYGVREQRLPFVQMHSLPSVAGHP